MYTHVLSSLTLIHIELFKKTRLCYELQNLTVTLLLGAHKTMLLAGWRQPASNLATMLPSCCIYAAAVISQKCKVVKRSAEPDTINWEMCCLCQEEKDDHLSMPNQCQRTKVWIWIPC